jgi:hypothetical protein
MPQRLDVTTKDFKKNERLKIKAPTLTAAFIEFGKLHKKEIQTLLAQSLNEFPKTEQDILLQKAKALHQKLDELSGQGLFAIGKTNYLARYLAALDAYAKGAQITVDQAIFLQLDIFPGCQTLVIKNLTDNSVRFLHTEENALDEDFYKGRYNYRLVEMQFAGTHMTFFAYPGLCGWGPAFCINHVGGMVQMVDDLYATPAQSDGPLWVNAFVFMTADAANPEVVRALIDRTHAYKGYLFTNGHAAHQVYNTGEIISFECLHKDAKLVQPVTFEGKQIAAQSNIPRHPNNLPLSDSYLPSDRSKWSRSRVLLYQEMSRRAKRLELYGKYLNVAYKGSSESISFLEHLIGASIGDLEMEQLSKNKYHYVQTGISSSWTVATLVGYMSPKKSQLKIIKSVPEPIYSVNLLQELSKNDLMTKDIYTLSTQVINGTTI